MDTLLGYGGTAEDVEAIRARLHHRMEPAGQRGWSEASRCHRSMEDGPTATSYDDHSAARSYASMHADPGEADSVSDRNGDMGRRSRQRLVVFSASPYEFSASVWKCEDPPRWPRNQDLQRMNDHEIRTCQIGGCTWSRALDGVTNCATARSTRAVPTVLARLGAVHSGRSFDERDRLAETHLLDMKRRAGPSRTRPFFTCRGAVRDLLGRSRAPKRRC